MENKEHNDYVDTVDVDATSEQTPNESKAAQNPQDYFKKGMDDAARKAEEFAPKFKREVESVISEVAYGAGFVPGFIGTIMSEFLPENVKKSMSEGVYKGEESARSVARKMRETSSQSKPDDSQYAPPQGA